LRRLRGRVMNDETLSRVVCADGWLVVVTQVDDPGDHRGSTYWLVSEYPPGWGTVDAPEDLAEAITHEMVRVWRVARLMACGLVGEHGGSHGN
jgi:hypothetical protein